MDDEQILQFMVQQNKPYSVQGVHDMLASKGAKKAQVQKSLAALAEKQIIKCKEFGKTQIYFALQDELAVLTKEDKDTKNALIKDLSAESQQLGQEIAALNKELQGLSSTLTLVEIQEHIDKYNAQIKEAEAKLAVFRQSANLIPPEEKKQVEQAFTKHMEQWSKRKHMFRAIWDQVSENLEGKQADLFEEVGVETDEQFDLNYQDMNQLMPKQRKTK